MKNKIRNYSNRKTKKKFHQNPHTYIDISIYTTSHKHEHTHTHIRIQTHLFAQTLRPAFVGPFVKHRHVGWPTWVLLSYFLSLCPCLVVFFSASFRADTEILGHFIKDVDNVGVFRLQKKNKKKFEPRTDERYNYCKRPSFYSRPSQINCFSFNFWLRTGASWLRQHISDLCR